MLFGIGMGMFFVYFAAAVLPALFLMRYIYRADKVEKEPAGLLVRCTIGGVLAAFAAVLLEEIGEAVLETFVDPNSPVYILFLAFLVVAGAEEAAKFFFLKRFTWRHPAFNFRFDGVVYAVFVSLGFAAFENVGYVLGYGLSVAPMRAILSIPAHMSFAVFMGVFYGRAKLLEGQGDRKGAKKSCRLGLLAAIFLHGVYDACAMYESGFSMLVFLVFVIAMDVITIRLVRGKSASDEPV